ncbi:MAG: hypothetical protein NTY68_01575 [Candidatus Micrarchaeota archaeon]|nr:hypothetical protein [Candidatus Micrarchaeota archaeon]
MAEARNEKEVFFTALFEGKRGKDWKASGLKNYFEKKYVKNEGDTYILSVPASATETGVFKDTRISFMFFNEPTAIDRIKIDGEDDKHQTYLFKFKDTAAIVDVIIHDLKNDKEKGISIEMRPRNGKSKRLVVKLDENRELNVLVRDMKTDNFFTNQGNAREVNFMQITKNLEKPPDYPFRLARVENDLTRVQAFNPMEININLAENTEKIPKRKTLPESDKKKEEVVYVKPPKTKQRNYY